MSEKAQYRTRQITELENYLCSMEGKHVTVSDICKYFKISCNEDSLAFHEDLVNKFSADGGAGTGC